MVDLKFRIRSTVLQDSAREAKSLIRPITLKIPCIEEAGLLGTVDNSGRLIPNNAVFKVSHHRTGWVIEGFIEDALGEFMKAQLESLSPSGIVPKQCEIRGLDTFLKLSREAVEVRTPHFRDLIQVYPDPQNMSLTPSEAVAALEKLGLGKNFIVIGVDYQGNFRRSCCITTFVNRPWEAVQIMKHLVHYLEGATKDGFSDEAHR